MLEFLATKDILFGGDTEVQRCSSMRAGGVTEVEAFKAGFAEDKSAACFLDAVS